MLTPTVPLTNLYLLLAFTFAAVPEFGFYNAFVQPHVKSLVAMTQPYQSRLTQVLYPLSKWNGECPSSRPTTCPSSTPNMITELLEPTVIEFPVVDEIPPPPISHSQRLPPIPPILKAILPDSSMLSLFALTIAFSILLMVFFVKKRPTLYIKVQRILLSKTRARIAWPQTISWQSGTLSSQNRSEIIDLRLQLENERAQSQQLREAVASALATISRLEKEAQERESIYRSVSRDDQGSQEQHPSTFNTPSSSTSFACTSPPSYAEQGCQTDANDTSVSKDSQGSPRILSSTDPPSNAPLSSEVLRDSRICHEFKERTRHLTETNDNLRRQVKLAETLQTSLRGIITHLRNDASRLKNENMRLRELNSGHGHKSVKLSEQKSETRQQMLEE